MENDNNKSSSSSSTTTSDDITRTEDDMTDLVTDNEQPVIISTFKNFEPTRAATTVNDPLDGIVSNNSFVVQDKSFTKNNSNNNNNNSKQQQHQQPNNNHTKSHASRSKSVFGGLGGLKVFSNMRKTFVSEASTSTNDQLTPQQMKRNRTMTTLNNPTTSSATTTTSASSSTTHMGNGASSAVTRTNSSPLISSNSSPNASNRASLDDSIIHNNNNNNNTMDHDAKKKSHDNNSNSSSSHSLHSSTTADQDASSIVNNNDEFVVVLDENTTMVSDVDIVPLKYTEEEAQTIISDSCLLYKRRSNFFSFIKNDAYLREQRLRRSTIKELYYTEMSYISTLELGYREYYKPMLTDAKQQQKHLTNKNSNNNNSTTLTNNSESTDDPNANHTNNTNTNNQMSDEHFMFENGEEDLNVIFSNIDQIIHMNKQLALEVLSDARHNSVAMFHPPSPSPSPPSSSSSVSSSDSTPQKSNMNTSNKYYRKSMIEEEICWMYCNVGQIFVKYSPFFKIYATFVNDFDASNQKIEDLNQRSVKFARFLEVTSDRIQKELSSILITVVQRIPRYELLFRDLLKRTEEDHVDYASIAKALNKINEQASFINEKKRHYENQVFYVRLQQNLLQNHHHYSQLVQPGRVYMKQMQQVIVSCRRRDLNHVSACYLCNDILIVVPSAPVVVASSAAQQQQLMRKRKNALVHHQHSNIQVIFLAFSRVKQMNHSLPVNFAQSSSSVDTATTTTNSSTTASATINNGNGADAEHNSTSDTSSATQYDCETPNSAINSLHQSLSDAIEVKSFQLETWFENSVLTFTFTTESAFQCMELFESLEEQIVDLKRKLSWKLANAKLSADIVDDQSFAELLNDNQSTTSPSAANNSGEVESSSSASPGEITASVATIESTAEAELSGGDKASSSSTAPPTVSKAASSVDGLELKRVRLYNRFNALQKRIVRIESEQSTLKHHIQVKEFAMKNAKEQVAKVERQIKLEMESLKQFGNQLKEVETQYNQLNNRSSKAKGALAELDKAILYKVLNEDIEAFIQVFNREPECDLTSAMHTTIASSKKNKARMLMQQQQLQQSQEQQQTPVLPQLTLDHQALDLSLKLHKVSNKTQTLIDSSGVNLPQVAGYKATLPPLPSLAASGLSTDRSSSNTSSSPTPSAAAQYSPRQMGNNSGATNTSYYHLNQVEQSMLQQSLGSNGSSSPPLVVPLSSSPKTNNYSYSMRPSHMISKKRVQVRSKSTILGDDPYFRYVQNQIKRAALLSDTASDSGDDLSTDYSIDISSEDIGGSQQWLDNSLNPLYCIPAPQSYRYIQGDTLVYKYLCDRVRLGESTTYTTSDRVDELFDLNIDNRPSNKTSMDHQFETASTTTAPTDLDSSPSPTTMIQPMDVVETGEFDPLLWDESDLPNDPQVLKAMIGKLQTSCLAWKNRCTNNE